MRSTLLARLAAGAALSAVATAAPLVAFPTAALAAPQCSDGIDNDADGATDFPADPQCSNRNDVDESQ